MQEKKSTYRQASSVNCSPIRCATTSHLSLGCRPMMHNRSLRSLDAFQGPCMTNNSKEFDWGGWPKFERIVEDEKVLMVRKVGCNQTYIDTRSVGARLTRGPSQQPLLHPFSVISRIFKIPLTAPQSCSHTNHPPRSHIQIWHQGLRCRHLTQPSCWTPCGMWSTQWW